MSGSRRQRTLGRVDSNGHLDPAREFTSRVFNFILKTYLGVGFSDGMCGFKWLRRDVYQPLHEAGAESDGWFFSTELLTIAEWKHLKILELPVKWTDDVTSSRVKIGPLAKQYLAAMKVLRTKKTRLDGTQI